MARLSSQNTEAKKSRTSERKFCLCLSCSSGFPVTTHADEHDQSGEGYYSIQRRPHHLLYTLSSGPVYTGQFQALLQWAYVLSLKKG